MSHAPTTPTEVLLRINLQKGLTEDEITQLGQLSETEGGIQNAVLMVLRKGLDLAKKKRGSSKRIFGAADPKNQQA